MVEDVSWLPASRWISHLSEVQPTSFPPNPHHVEQAYLRASLDPSLWAKLPSDFPMEVFLIRELANPHSRSKKQSRWQARLAAENQLRMQMLREEVKDLRGRKRSVARREAIFRWKSRLETWRKRGINSLHRGLE